MNKLKEISKHLTKVTNANEIEEIIKAYTEEKCTQFGKICFYKGFLKGEIDDANCYTAWREEAYELIENFKKLL